MARVREYQREVNGKLFTVKSYNTKRQRSLDLNAPHKFRAAGRPPLAAQPGNFPASRRFPGIFLRYSSVLPEAQDPAQVQRDIEEAVQIVTDEGLKVVFGPSAKAQAAIALLRRHGHTVKALSGQQKAQMAQEEEDAKPKTPEDQLRSMKKQKAKKKPKHDVQKLTGEVFTHPSTGFMVDVPEGGRVWRHKRFKDSFIVLSADLEPLYLVNRAHRVQKAPPHTKLDSYVPQVNPQYLHRSLSPNEAGVTRELALAAARLRKLAE